MERDWPEFDLHLHTWFSDGTFSPQELLRKCKELGLKVVAITDHESIRGISEALNLSKNLGIEVIPGIEFACNWKKTEHHILGYFIDYQSKKLENFIESWRKAKQNQIKKMIRKLQNFELRVSFEEVLAQSRDSLGYPHISDAVFSHPQNLTFLEKNYGIETKKEFFRKFLINQKKDEKGKTVKEGIAYVERKMPELEKVLDLIAQIKGISIWAHPFWKGHSYNQVKKMTIELRKLGLDGIETCYPFYDEHRASFLHQIVQDWEMLESGGSDFHGGEDREDRNIAQFQTYGIKINFPFDR